MLASMKKTYKGLRAPKLPKNPDDKRYLRSCIAYLSAENQALRDELLRYEQLLTDINAALLLFKKY